MASSRKIFASHPKRLINVNSFDFASSKFFQSSLRLAKPKLFDFSLTVVIHGRN